MPDYYQLDPPARFGTIAPGNEGLRAVRVFVSHEGVAAVLDGLRIEDYGDILNLLGVAISVITKALHDDADPSDTGFDREEFATEIEVLGSRLPLAALAMRDLLIERETGGPGFDSAAREERRTEMEAILTGVPVAFKVTKAEKRQLLKTIPLVRGKLAVEDGRDELDLLLGDLERGRVLSSLPLPQLVYWCRPLMEETYGPHWSKVHRADTKEEEQRARAETDVLREMWIRLGREIHEFGRG
jgi:hypothetical protein